MIYAPPGSYPPGADQPGPQSGYRPVGGGYQASGYGPGYGGGPGYPSDYGYGPGGYGPGGYGPGGYGPGGYYPPGGGGYGPGGYGPDDIIGGGYGRDRPPRRGSRILTYVVVAALAAGVGAGTVLALNHNAGDSSPSSAQPGLGLGPQPGAGSGGGPGGGTSANSAATQAVTRKVGPGIVDVISKPGYQSGTLEGTGMVLSSNGLVLTNNHVVEGTSSWKVKIADTGQIYGVTVLGTDVTDDVALLKLTNASNLRTVPLGNSSSVQMGDSVVALGNADGQDGKPTVVTGSITGLNQSIKATDQGAGTTENLHGMLRTNAPIISGDSGGALANTQGQVIGMNTAANNTTTFGGGQGTSTGFAIPINRALAIARQIASGNASSNVQIGLPAFLGVTVASASSGPSTDANPRAQLRQLEQAAEQGGFNGFGGGSGGSGGSGCMISNAQASIPRKIASVSSGTLISGVLCNTPVSSAGMTAGSVITSINGQAVTAPDTLTKVLTQFRPGETVSVHWVSPNGQQHTSSVKLAPGPAK